MPICIQTELEKEADCKIGHRIMQLRKLKKMTQNDLSDLTGISYQQIQKYKKAINRISASRLYLISRALKVEMNQFFLQLDQTAEELPEEVVVFKKKRPYNRKKPANSDVPKDLKIAS